MSSQPAPTASALDVSPLQGAEFGAEIKGLEPLHISQADLDVIWETYRERHGLICFSFGRLLEAEELHALTTVFGESEFAPGMINGIGKGVTPGEEHLTVEEQVARLESRGIDPYLAFIGNVDNKTLDV